MNNGATKQSHLVISALGEDRPGLVNDLSLAVFNSGCNIVDSRMTVLGGDFAILLLVSGNWNNLAKLEGQLGKLEERLTLTISSKRTEPRTESRMALPYTVEVVSLDHPGIVYRLANFFSTRGITIHDLNTTSYAAAHTGTPMFAVNMTVDIPAEVHIAVLREEFMVFCDELNLDAIIEPIKG